MSFSFSVTGSILSERTVEGGPALDSQHNQGLEILTKARNGANDVHQGGAGLLCDAHLSSNLDLLLSPT